MSVLCHSCKKVCADYHELASHIMAMKKGHRMGKKWAAKYVMHTRQLARKEIMGRNNTPLTDEQKQTKKELVREVSGNQERVLTICPKCKTKRADVMEVEYTHSETAWKIGNCLARVCVLCR